ncbi:hypothetical protein PR002_g31015 [Phytophthora rubi]|nr:hypothetical protein PR002_g31015 [Phytophthora rubi]
MGQQSTGWNTPHRDRSSPDPKRSSPAEEVSDEGLGGDPGHEETCVDADRPTGKESVVAGSPEAPAATAEEGAVSGGREDDWAQSDEVRDQEPMCKVGSHAEEVTRSPTQSATKQIPHEDGRASATAPTPDTIPRGLPDQASNDPKPNPDPETRRGEPEGGSEVCYHDGGTLEAEEVDGEWAVLPEVSPATIEVRIEDLQVGDLTDNTEDEIRKLRDIIWAHRHLLTGYRICSRGYYRRKSSGIQLPPGRRLSW